MTRSEYNSLTPDDRSEQEQRDTALQLLPLDAVHLSSSDDDQRSLTGKSGAPQGRDRGGIRSSTSFAILCRSLRLRLLRLLFASRCELGFKEERKVAVHRNRCYAVLRCSVHVLPVTVAVALIALNGSQYYVGGELTGPVGQDDQKLNALQFAAKLHELMMLASLAAIVFTYLRRELIFGEGIPYGALAAGLEIDNLSFLYSPELWAAVWAQWERRHKKWMLLSLLVFTTLLGVTVGPSSANLMRPRLENWPAGGTQYWTNAPADAILPSSMVSTPEYDRCMANAQDFACPHGDWYSIATQFQAYWPRLLPMGGMPEMISLSSPLSSRIMVIRRRSTEDRTRSIWSNAFTSATIQQSVVADGLTEVGRLWSYAAANSNSRQNFVWRRDASFSTTAPQPVAQARCEEDKYSSLTTVKNISFPILAKPMCDGDNVACHVRPISYTSTTNETLINELVAALKATNETPSLLWVEDDGAKPDNSSAVVLAIFPQTGNKDSRFYRCTIDAVMANTTISTTRNVPKLVMGYAAEFKSIGTSNSSWPRVQISSSWGKFISSRVERGNNLNGTVFSQSAEAAGMWNGQMSSASYNYPFIVESILATLVANGIARSTYNSTMIGSLRGPYDPDNVWRGGKWQDYFLPRNSLSFNGPQSIFDELNATELASSSQFTMHAHVLGYAWSWHGMIQKANMVSLIVYVLFACTHFIYSASSGKSSSAWDTVPEIVALAAQSQRPYDAMQNTGAGIETVNPLKQKVRVRNVNDHLEYIFEGPCANGGPIRANCIYA